jgi:hypothetical protein
MVVVKSKLFRILMLLVLLPGVLIDGVMAEACRCIQPCSFGLQDEIDARENTPFHSHHSNSHCKSCSIEDGQTFKAAVSSTSVCKAKALDNPFVLLVLADSDSNSQIHERFIPELYDKKAIPSSPTYLLNLCILC